MSEEDLWGKDQLDDIMDEPAPKHRRGGQITQPGHHIGCPLKWFTRVYPVVHGKNELAVALYIYRLRIIQHSRTVKVSNTRLLDELGINRYAKYRTLKRLAKAGIITIKRHSAPLA